VLEVLEARAGWLAQVLLAVLAANKMTPNWSR
jgi:hypothetical protein